MFSTSTLCNDIQNGSIPRCEKVIVGGEPAVPICLLGDLAYPLLPCLMKEFANGGKDKSAEFFGFCLFSAQMVIECAFGKLKAHFGLPRRKMDISVREVPDLINSCFVLNNFCEERREPLMKKISILH